VDNGRGKGEHGGLKGERGERKGSKGAREQRSTGAEVRRSMAFDFGGGMGYNTVRVGAEGGRRKLAKGLRADL